MSAVKKALLGALAFLFPLLFLTTTQDFFLTNKFYLLVFGALILLAISTVGIIVSRKITWKRGPFDAGLSFLLVASAISIIFFSPNKVGALLSQNYGLLALLSLTIVFMYIEKMHYQLRTFNLLRYSTFVLSLITIFFFLQPFKNATISPVMQFLRNPSFTPMGNRLDLALFLGFFLIASIVEMVRRKRHNAFDYVFVVITAIATGVTVFRIFSPETAAQTLLMPPFDVSWRAAVESLKNPLNALFGIGVDNFSSVFSLAKSAQYNQTPLWTINSFNIGRSAVLQIFTETGLLGLLAFGLLLWTGLQHIQRDNQKDLLFASLFTYMVVVFFIFPISLPMLFLFFIVLTLTPRVHEETQHFNLGSVVPLYVLVVIVFVAVLGGLFYLVGRAYASEIYFRKSFIGLLNNNAKELYDNQREAVILNPFMERYRSNFAQTNLIIAVNIAQRANPPQTAEGQQTKPRQLTKEERQTITQGIQASIQEAKAVVALNPQKATNWQGLAIIYRNLLNAAQGADVWTVSSYQRTIVLDPNNPIYRLNLGGVFYSLKNYPDAIRLFEQAVVLRPTWANAHYNLAWANFQNKSYANAIRSMENVLRLIDKNKTPDDYKRVVSELEEFKKKLPLEGKDSTGSASQELNLPTNPQPEISPKVELPKDASPEAR